MGISGLLTFLQDASRECHIKEFKGCTVAVDSYCWLHKGAFACADKLVRGENTNVHIRYCLRYISMLQSYGIKVILVFDGQDLPAKIGTEEKRREQRKFARTKGMELLRLGKIEEARQYFRQCVNITHEMALALIVECRKRNVDYVVAPYEADAQLAYLNLKGIAQLIITEDSDLVLFGCTKTIFKFNINGTGILIEKEKLNDALKMRPDQYSFDKFRYMCIMSGCDYLDSLPGIGLKRAHKAITMTHDPNIYNLLRRLPSYLNLRSLNVSDDYIENFKLADATFQHQVVYDPTKRMLLHLTDPEECGTNAEYLKNAGKICDSNLALNLALGNVDPVTLKVVDNWNPDQEIVFDNSIWSRNYKPSNNIVQKMTTNSTTSFSHIPLGSKQSPSTKSRTSQDTLDAIEHAKDEFDKKLMAELQVYSIKSPPVKRQKLESNEDEQHIPVNKDPEVKREIYNPFLIRNHPKKLSKFEPTRTNEEEHVRSRFFATNTNVSHEKEIVVETSDSKKLICDNNLEPKKSPLKKNLVLYDDISEIINSSLEEVDNQNHKSSETELLDEMINVDRQSPILSFCDEIDREMRKSYSNMTSTKRNIKSFAFKKYSKKISACNLKQSTLDFSSQPKVINTESTFIETTSVTCCSNLENSDEDLKGNQSHSENLTPETVAGSSQVSGYSEEFKDQITQESQNLSTCSRTKSLVTFKKQTKKLKSLKLIQPTILNTFSKMTSKK